MAPIRLRHPKGVSTIQVAFDLDTFTVQDLQQEIFAVSEIPPSLQDLKSGYPPRSLTIVPELPLASLGLKTGEQIIVSQKPDTSRGVAPPPPPSSSAHTSSSNPRPSPPVPTPFAASRVQPTAPAPARALSPLSPTLAPSASGPEHVETDGGFLIHRVVPDDNSCLFSSVALIFEQDIAKAQQMRKIVAAAILASPETYSAAILGSPPEKYTQTILNPMSWGGAIELGILAAHYETEIDSVDVETGRVDQFTYEGGGGGGMRCILLYSGIHYDAVTLAPMLDAPAEWHQTVFPITSSSTDSDPIILAAKKLATALRAKKAFTNTSTFDLKCEDCGQGLKGEKGARAHAEQTGHVRFGEY